MDFVKREDQNVIDEEYYKLYLENLQKSHQMEDYQHTQISMEQLHQAMQSSINTTLVPNFNLPLSPRQMSTLMLRTNHLTRNDLPTHLRNIELDIHNLNELQNRHDDILTQNLNRNIDLSILRGNDIDLQSGLVQTLQNMSDDLRSEVIQSLPHDLNQEIDLSHHLSRQSIPDLLEDRRTPMVIHLPDNHLLDQVGRMDQVGRIESRIDQRLDQVGRIESRLDQVGRMESRLDQVGRMDQVGRLDQRLDQVGRIESRIDQRIDQVVRIDQRLDQGGRIDQVVRIDQRLDQGRLDQGRLDQVSRIDQIGQRLVNERLDQNVMQFQIKAEQEDDYFYDNINQGINSVDGINGQISDAHTQPNPSIQTDTQMYSIYPPHANIPTLNTIDMYRNQFPQSFIRENPQNLVIHRQYDNASPYHELKKQRQDGGGELGAKEPKENLKPIENKIFFNEFVNKDENSSKIDDLNLNIKGEYVCYKCNEVFPSKRGLKQHAKSCMDVEMEKIGKFSCTQCAYRCQSPAILKIHERTHSGEKPFSCNFCDYKSGQKNNVAKHILVHMKEKPFKCQYCDYRCAQKNNLVVHERTHTGYKPFACNFCDYRTVQKPNLVKHMYLHTDQKPFSCDVCNYRCVQKTNLTKHKQRHLNEKDGVKINKEQVKPYRPRQKSVKCPNCPYRCVQKSSMEKHMKFKHNTENFENINENFDTEFVQNLSVKKDDVSYEVARKIYNDIEKPMELQS